jgi:hypothetical protein
VGVQVDKTIILDEHDCYNKYGTVPSMYSFQYFTAIDWWFKQYDLNIEKCVITTSCNMWQDHVIVTLPEEYMTLFLLTFDVKFCDCR